MKKIIILILTMSIAMFLFGCGSKSSENFDINTTENVEKAENKSANNEKTYTNIESESIPEGFPKNLFPLSSDINDKIMDVNTDNETIFDLKIVTIRTYQEIINEYAALWELEGESAFFNDDIGVGNLTGTYKEYEIFVNASENSPEMPEGARTYCGLLIQKKK